MDFSFEDIEESMTSIVSSVESGKLARDHGRADLLRLKEIVNDTQPDAWNRVVYLYNRFNACAPVNQLPTEILYLIFLALDNHPLHNTPVRVCAHWRTVALSEPRLWSTIMLGPLRSLPILLERARGAEIHCGFWISPPRLRLIDAGIELDAYSMLLQYPEARVASLRVSGMPSTSWPRNADHKNTALPFLHHLSATFMIRPGEWLKNITFLALRFVVPVDTLAEILSSTPNLQILHVPSVGHDEGPTSDGLIISQVPTQELAFRPPSSIPPRWLRLISPLPTIPRVTVALTELDHDQLDAWRLMENVGHVSALGLFVGENKICIALKDVHKRGRQFCVKHAELTNVFRTLFGTDFRLLRDLERLTFSISLWQNDVLKTLMRSTGLLSLTTVIVQVEPWHASDYILRPPQGVIPCSLGLGLEEIAVVRIPRTRQGPRMQVSPDRILEFVQAITERPSLLPLLRLVNMSLESRTTLGASQGLAQWCRERIRESSWDHDDDRNSWISVPEYFARW